VFTFNANVHTFAARLALVDKLTMEPQLRLLETWGTSFVSYGQGPLRRVPGAQQTRDSSLGIGTGCGLEGRVSILGSGKRFFSIPQRPDWLLAQLVSYRMGTGGSFPGGKAAGREADHSPPSSAEVRYGGAIPPLSHTSSWRSA
jgi:hypothetical protein